MISKKKWTYIQGPTDYIYTGDLNNDTPTRWLFMSFSSLTKNLEIPSSCIS